MSIVPEPVNLQNNKALNFLSIKRGHLPSKAKEEATDEALQSYVTEGI